jgi:hypothetical protein
MNTRRLRSLRHALTLVLFVADLFHPVDDLAFVLLLNGDMRHGRGRRGSVPVLLTGRKPDDITRPNLRNPPLRSGSDPADAYAMRSARPARTLRWRLEPVPDRVPGKANRSVPCQ